MKERVKTTFKRGVSKAATYGLAVYFNTMRMYCDAFKDAEKGISTLGDKIYSLAKVLFPVAIAVVAIGMFFTDGKEFKVLRGMLVGICGAFAILVIVFEKDNLAETIIGLF